MMSVRSRARVLHERRTRAPRDEGGEDRDETGDRPFMIEGASGMASASAHPARRSAPSKKWPAASIRKIRGSGIDSATATTFSTPRTRPGRPGPPPSGFAAALQRKVQVDGRDWGGRQLCEAGGHAGIAASPPGVHPGPEGEPGQDEVSRPPPSFSTWAIAARRSSASPRPMSWTPSELPTPRKLYRSTLSPGLLEGPPRPVDDLVVPSVPPPFGSGWETTAQREAPSLRRRMHSIARPDRE